MADSRLRLRVCMLVLAACSLSAIGNSDDFRQRYDEFANNAKSEYSSFRDECNRKYARLLLTAWDWYAGKAPLPVPKEDNHIPPRPYQEGDKDAPIEINPTEIDPIETEPRPAPITPIEERPTSDDKFHSFNFYGNDCKIRLPEAARLNMTDCSPKSISNAWEILCDVGLNNAIRDCLEARSRYNLCDWAYLMFLDEMSKAYCDNENDATMLMAFLYCQSGYQMRLAVDRQKLIMLYGSKHLIFDKGHYSIDTLNFYPYGPTTPNSISICDASFEGETPMSLLIPSEQLLGGGLSKTRTIQSERYGDLKVASSVPENLLLFYSKYPTSALGWNPLTRWAMYANTPLAQETKDLIYPALKNSIDGLSAEEAANRLLNWVQTGFTYELDDKIWGRDRAFFAEESLYYPYCDCEDRSILFSRLVRDLLGLETALIYYPGHLATAVCFNDEVKGDSMLINGRCFTVCDPTYIGAPVGAQMPGLAHDKAKAIILAK